MSVDKADLALGRIGASFFQNPGRPIRADRNSRCCIGTGGQAVLSGQFGDLSAPNSPVGPCKESAQQSEGLLFIRICVFALITTIAAADPLTINGPSRVIDGDTVVVAGIHVRLRGVDAAKRGTVRGDEATQIMLGIVNGSDLHCTLTGEKNLPSGSRLLHYSRWHGHQSANHRNGDGLGLPKV